MTTLFPEDGALAPERTARVKFLIEQAYSLVDEAVATLGDGKQIVAEVILFSGGNDSTVLAHLFKDRASHVAHANTGIGIEQTRQFVRDISAAWGLPLLEKHPPTSYRELVIDQGFPGPGHHWKMYHRLKERCLRQVRRDLVLRPRQERVVFLAGRRRAESQRRASLEGYDRVGSVIFVSPLLNWNSEDMNTYRAMHPDVPRNEVADLLHMSGECLCGSFAKVGELDEIGMWFPEVRREIEALELEVAASGKHPEQRCHWGWAAGLSEKPSKVGPLCSSCEFRALTFDDLLKDESLP